VCWVGYETPETCVFGKNVNNGTKGKYDMAKIDIPPSTGPTGAQEEYFTITNQIPEQVWYWAALGSIITSAILFLSDRKDWSIFVGQWPPTFLLFGLYHKLLKPSR
jgi:hypothetical protein